MIVSRFLVRWATPVILWTVTLPAWAVGCPDDKPHLKNPLTGDCSPISLFVLYGRVIRMFLILIGALALIFAIYGGFLWLTSAGNSEKIEQGRNTLIWAILGVVTALLSYVVLNFLLGSVLPAVNS